MRLSDAAVLLAVGAVVLLVSLLRLRDFALRENESDARSLVERLGRMLERDVQAAERGSIAELLQTDSTFVKQLDDVEFLADGTLLRRHGYLFEVSPRSNSTWVRAWPWRYRETGLGAFAWNPERRLVGHANEQGEWSGLDERPQFAVDADWRDLEEGR
ncbi:MAG: hypothetical protein IT454_14395 [Planctomycetes bacterium]|nr:hypothetical protein [Planctomycetota bacterium]